MDRQANQACWLSHALVQPILFLHRDFNFAKLLGKSLLISTKTPEKGLFLLQANSVDSLDDANVSSHGAATLLGSKQLIHFIQYFTLLTIFVENTHFHLFIILVIIALSSCSKDRLGNS
jgi:hypothetical protein